MNSAAALPLLLLLGQMAGTDPADVRAPAVPEAGGAARVVLRLPLSEVDREQARAAVWQDAGRSRLGFIAAMGPENLWMKVLHGRSARAWSLDVLEQGAEAVFDYQRFRFVLESGYLRAYPVLPPQTPQARVSVPAALRSVYTAAAQVLITPVRYAVLHEDGSSAPASVSLLREDDAGRFWLTYKTPEELRSIHWFVAVNGVLYGMRLEGEELVFYSKPNPLKGFLAGERPLEL